MATLSGLQHQVIFDRNSGDITIIGPIGFSCVGRAPPAGQSHVPL